MSELNQRQPLAMPWMVHRRAPVTHRRGMAATVLPGAVWLPAVWLVLVGSGLQGYANATLDAFFVGLLFLGAGLVAVRLLFRRGQAEQRVFLLTYGICVFVGGLAQCYSLATFGDPQSTRDAYNAFFPYLAAEPPFTTLADLPRLHNSRLAILIWQQAYKLTWWLGWSYGPHIAVMFNALVIGLAGSITVRTTCELFGNDAWRLRRVGTLFAFCGMFWLFGGVLLRDCFTTFFQALVLWSLVRWLVQPTPRNLLTAAAITGLAAWAMAYLREESILLFGLYWTLALLFWFRRRPLDGRRLVALVAALIAVLFAGAYLSAYVGNALGRRASAAESYAAHGADTHHEDSLGMRLVVNQPLPIRLVLGTGALMIYPIPLWAGLKAGAKDIILIKGYHGFYQVLMLPLVLAGFLLASREFRRGRLAAVPLTFLAAYLLLNTASVVATSLETRHVAQFLPAFLILAAVPDTRDKRVFREVKQIATGWFAVVLLVHLAWAVVKGSA